MACHLTDLLVEATVLGTSYRKLLCYDLTAIDSLGSLKTRVLNDLKVAGAPLQGDHEVVLRNYQLILYELTLFTSEASESCALIDQKPGGRTPARHGCLLAASPSPRVPVDPVNEDRHSVLAIASRQFYDRTRGSGAVLPLEARIKPLTPAVTPSADSSAAGASAQSLQSQAAASGSLLSKDSAVPQTFDVTVRDFRGRSHTARVCGQTSVLQMKQGVAAALGCSVVSHWRVCHEGRLLADDLDLDDYNIRAGSVIDVILSAQQSAMVPLGLPAKAAVSNGSPIRDTAAAAAAAGAAPTTARKGAAGGGDRRGGSSSSTTTTTTITAQRTSNRCTVAAAASGAAGEKAAGQAHGPGQHRNVQVLLPSGQIVMVPRWSSEEPSHFTQRVVEVARSLPWPPADNSRRMEPWGAAEADGATAAAAAAGAAPVEAAGAADGVGLGETPATDATDSVPLLPLRAVSMAAAAAAGAQAQPLATSGDSQSESESAESKSESPSELDLGPVGGPAARDGAAPNSDIVKAAHLAARLAASNSRRQHLERSSRGCRQATRTLLDGALGQKLVALLLAAAAVVMAMAAL